MPAMWLKSSAIRCAVAPVPEDENEYLSGFAFRSATNSLALFAGKSGRVTSANELVQVTATGARSFSGS